MHSAATATSLVAFPRLALAEELAVATFSAGDPRFMQPVFDDIKYAGVRKCEIGSIGGVPAIRVTYTPAKMTYKRLVGSFWRSCDPTSVAQFGEDIPSPN